MAGINVDQCEQKVPPNYIILSPDRLGMLITTNLGTLGCMKRRMAGRERLPKPNPDQICRAEFNELLFISIALKLKQNFVDFLMIRSRGLNALHR